MIDARGFTVFCLCAVLAIAITLASTGVVVLFDAATTLMDVPGRVHLKPAGGVLALMLGASLIAVVFRWRWLATLLTIILGMLALAFAVMPILADAPPPAWLMVKPLLLFLTVMVSVGILAAVWVPGNRGLTQVIGAIGFTFGLLSLLSHWHEAFAAFTLGSIPEANVVTSPMAMLVSLALPFLGRIFHQNEEVPYRGLVAVGTVSILVTTFSWHVLRVQQSSYLMAQADVLIGQVYLPPLLLFSGLGLSFLVMLSHQFWRESERRSQSLKTLNDTLNFHLEQERVLRHTNDRILEFSRDILCSIGHDNRFLQISPACEEILGYRPEELLGTDYTELLVQEDRAPTREEVRLLVAGEQAQTSGFRNRMVHRDGRVVTLSWSAEWSTEDQALFCVGRDITDRLVAETLTREREQFFSLSPDMFCIVDLNTYFFETNTTFVDTLGYAREELIGTSYLDIVHPDDHPVVVEAVDALREGRSISGLLVRVLTRNGEALWLNINAILSADDLIFVVARDITEQRRVREELERSNRELQDFAFVASHDLQEPLRKIQAFSDRLLSRSERLNEQEQDYLNRMQSAAGRMQNLIEDLLSYSRVTTRARAMVPCNTAVILDEVLQDMETTISREQAQIHIGELPDAFGDATQLRQVFQNLLSNAIKFHQPGQAPDITIEAEDVSERAWTLVITDRGIGFDPRYAEKLFHPFQRLHQKAGYAGTGIGMAIVKKILDRHGATVTAHSEPGEGTTFRIRFSRG